MKIFDHKDEVLYIQSGTIVATVADENIFSKPDSEFRKLKLVEGDVLSIQAGCPYSLMADEDSIVVEISTGGMSTACVRFLDDYGRVDNDPRSDLVTKKLENLS